jgi:hypothetical protein
VTVAGAGNEEAATVVQPDVLVGKGVVHILDRALGECYQDWEIATCVCLSDMFQMLLHPQNRNKCGLIH